MTPELHATAKAQADVSISALMGWVANAQRLMDGGKLDLVAVSRMGELLLNACKYLDEREAAAKKAADWAKRDAEREARTAENAARNAAIYRVVTASK